MAYQGRYQKPRAKKKGGIWKTLFIVLLCIILLAAAVVAVGWFYLNSKVDKITQAQIVEQNVEGKDLSHLIGNLDETEPSMVQTEPAVEAETEPVTEAPTTEETTEPTTEATEPDYGDSGKVVNILLIGQDSRAGEESKLADGIMLMTLNKETRTLAMTSFLRDSYVNLPDYYRGHTCGWNRINTSYALGYAWFGNGGAMEMLDLTLENNYGVKVDGNVEISFDTFIHVVDALGGVEINLEGDEYKQMLWWADIYNEHYEWLGLDTRVEVHEGMNTLNGDMALTYARERHMNAADNDMNRAGRQRTVLVEIIRKLTKLNPLELDKMVNMVCEEIVTDISPDMVKTYIRELLPFIFDLNMLSYQCPAEGTYWGEIVKLPDGDGGVLKIDFNKNRKILAAIQKGEIPE